MNEELKIFAVFGMWVITILLMITLLIAYFGPVNAVTVELSLFFGHWEAFVDVVIIVIIAVLGTWYLIDFINNVIK